MGNDLCGQFAAILTAATNVSWTVISDNNPGTTASRNILLVANGQTTDHKFSLVGSASNGFTIFINDCSAPAGLVGIGSLNIGNGNSIKILTGPNIWLVGASSGYAMGAAKFSDGTWKYVNQYSSPYIAVTNTDLVHVALVISYLEMVGGEIQLLPLQVLSGSYVYVATANSVYLCSAGVVQGQSYTDGTYNYFVGNANNIIYCDN